MSGWLEDAKKRCEEEDGYENDPLPKALELLERARGIIESSLTGYVETADYLRDVRKWEKEVEG